MRIDVLCTDSTHPVVPFVRSWIAARVDVHDVRMIHDKSEITTGDILFLVSCSQLISAQARSQYNQVMVLHASDLPKGRGWSPHIWEILAGKEELTLSLISAEEGVDTGAIWAKRYLAVPRHALHEEINEVLFQAEMALMDLGIAMVAAGKVPTPQPTERASYYHRRTPEDSRLDPSKSLADLFDQIRVADPDRFPAFFEMHGFSYELTLKKKET